MCIHCGTNKYRKIYQNHYGPIPREADGRTFEIHHIDGNHQNNHPENLVAITLQEHYNIHLRQGDYGACALMAKKLKMTPSEISMLATKYNNERVKNGTHPLMKRPDGGSFQTDLVKKGVHPLQTRPDGTNVQTDRVSKGTHPWQTRPDGTNLQTDKLKAGVHHFSGDNHPSKIRAKNGTHHMMDKEFAKAFHRNRINKGIHSTQKSKTCPHCNRIIGVLNYGKWHGDKCKEKAQALHLGY